MRIYHYFSHPPTSSNMALASINTLSSTFLPHDHLRFFIRYGNWSRNNATSIIPSFIRSLNGSSINNIATSYSSNGNSSGPFLSNQVTLSGNIAVGYPYGSSISDLNVEQIVTSVVGPLFPSDPLGLYFVLTSSDVVESSGFCTLFCGWHSFTSSSNLKFAFVGDPSVQCPNVCSAQRIGPNGNVGADAMVSVIAHEVRC